MSDSADIKQNQEGGGGESEEDKREITNCILEELEDMECFHGNMLEEDIKALLPVKGNFIIRSRITAEGSDAKDILLTVNVDGSPLDIKLKAKMVNKGPPLKMIYMFDKKTKTSSVKELVMKHMRGVSIMHQKEDNTPLQVTLLNPIPKQSWELRRDAIELTKKLGEGAFGEVHQGRLKMRFNKLAVVAVKVIKRSANNEKATTELQKEGALMRRFKHDNVVRTHGMVIERESIMVVMELVNGGSLQDYVKKNKCSMDDKAIFAHDIANGLGYLHQLGCIHRDIACRNCLYDLNKRLAKVSDFGLTRKTDKYKITSDERIPIRWCAPEVLETFIYDRAADIYAYGILVFEIISNGSVPYGDKTPNAEIKNKVKSPECLRPELPEDTSQELREVATNCWAADPATRYQMNDVKRVLARFKKVAVGDPEPIGQGASADGRKKGAGLKKPVKKDSKVSRGQKKK